MKTRSVVSTVVLLASGLAGPQAAQAAPAQVYPKCSFPVPARIAYVRPDQYVQFPLGPGCPKTVAEAVWGYTAPEYSFSLACNYQYGCYLSLSQTRVGPMTVWEPDGYAKDAKGNKVADLVPARSTTKSGTAVQLTGVRRSASATTLTARPTYYSVAGRKFVRHHGKVLFQKRDLGTSVWKDMGYATPNSAGVATFTVATARSRDYRAYVAETTTAWYAYSPTKRV
jgi:hypothetical protein